MTGVCLGGAGAGAAGVASPPPQADMVLSGLGGSRVVWMSLCIVCFCVLFGGVCVCVCVCVFVCGCVRVRVLVRE